MHPVTLQQMEQTLKESNGQTLCLWEKEKNCVIGAIFLEKDELRFGVSSCMISYYLNEIYAQKGYMTEALQSLIPFLFASGYAVISARVFADNIASAKLLQKAGFLKEGLLRHAVNDGKGKIHDDFLFSMVKEG